jgi:hypothetical protein
MNVYLICRILILYTRKTADALITLQKLLCVLSQKHTRQDDHELIPSQDRSLKLEDLSLYTISRCVVCYFL